MVKRWKFTTIHPRAKIGKGTMIGNFCEIGPVKIGKDVSIQAFVFIPAWVTIQDSVFIGPGVVFTNDKRPPSYGKYWAKTLVKKGASIGANATILPGITIGKKSIIGAGSTVTKDVPDGETWIGWPAHKIKCHFKKDIKFGKGKKDQK